jgi:hypothetical protein
MKNIKTTFPLFKREHNDLELSLVTDQKNTHVTLSGLANFRIQFSTDEAQILLQQLDRALKLQRRQEESIKLLEEEL